MKKAVLKKAMNITSTVLLILFVLLVVLMVGVRIFGIEPHVVLSGSMEPDIKTGSLVYVSKISPEEAKNLKPGDVVTYQVNQGGTKITHKIYNVVGPIPIYDTDENGNKRFDENGDPIVESYATDQKGETIVMYTTYGINNGGTLDGDPKVGNLASSNIVGKALFSIPLLGYFTAFVQSFIGRILTIVGCALLIVFTFMSGILNKGEKPVKSVEVCDSNEQETEVTEPENNSEEN